MNKPSRYITPFTSLQAPTHSICIYIHNIMDRHELEQYAELCEKVYEIEADLNTPLPKNWSVLITSAAGASYNTFFTLFGNTYKKELVLCVRGTHIIPADLLTDVALVAAAFTGKHRRPMQQDDVDSLGSAVRTNLIFAAADSEAFGKAANAYGHIVAEILEDWFVTSTFLALALLGVGIASQLVMAALPTAAAVAATGVAAAGVAPSFQQLLNLFKSRNAKMLNTMGSEIAKEATAELASAVSQLRRTYYRDFELKVIGHSLGGLMAELCAVEIGVECISFESPGALEILKQVDAYKDKPINVKSILSAPNPANMLNSHPGKVYRMIIPHTAANWKVKLKHRTNCLLKTGATCLVGAGAVCGGAAIAVSAGAATPIVVGAASVAGPVSIGALATVASSGLVDLWGDKTWYWKQHSIKSIVAFWKSPTVVMEMESWPKMELNLGTFAKKTAGWMASFIPFKEGQPGIRTLIQGEDKMREDQLKAIHGYKELKLVALKL